MQRGAFPARRRAGGDGAAEHPRASLPHRRERRRGELFRSGERLQRRRNRAHTRGGARGGVRPPAVEVRGVQGRPFGHRCCRVRLSLRRRLGGAGDDQGAFRDRVHSGQGRHTRGPRHTLPCRPGPGPRAVCPLRWSVGGGWPAPDRGGQRRREAVLPLVVGQPSPGQGHRGDRACTEGASVHGGRNHAAARRRAPLRAGGAPPDEGRPQGRGARREAVRRGRQGGQGLGYLRAPAPG